MSPADPKRKKTRSPEGSAAPVIVARVARAHGIRGGLLVESETDEPEALFQPGRRLLVLDPSPEAPDELAVVVARPHSGRWLLEVDGLDDRDAARRLRGALLAVPRDELPDLAEADYLLGDLIGCEVVEGEALLGQVTDVLDLPAGPMLVLVADGRERLVPFDAGFVRAVSLDEGRIEVELPAGLLEI